MTSIAEDRGRPPSEPCPPDVFNTAYGTDAATIPTTWDVQTIAAIAEVKTGPFGSALHERDYVKSGTPIITVEHLSERGILRHNLPLVSDNDRLRLKGFALRAGDIVFSRVGSVDRNALVSEAEDGWLFSGRLLRVRISSKSVLPAYLSYHFRSEDFKRRIRGVAVGQTMASLNTRILQGLRVAFPPFSEQCAIADALSDVDSMLSTLEELIAKKRATKRATMQPLLTGKTRLPGFSEEWKTKQLRDLLAYERPDRYTVKSTEYSNHGDIPVLTANKTFILGYTTEAFGVCTDLPAIVFDDFTTNSKFATAPFKVKSSAIKLLRPRHDRTNLKFMFERMQMIRFPVGDHKRHYISDYQNIRLPIPESEEQLAIVSVLSDMDAEITALEQRLTKARAIKQGMMQQLLTGKVRLVEPEQPNATTPAS